MQGDAGLANRRSNIIQRAAVVAVLARARGTTSISRADDGSVFVYDELRGSERPVTVRTKITPDGAVLPPVQLPYD
jgi:hypothetical protein